MKNMQNLNDENVPLHTHTRKYSEKIENLPKENFFQNNLVHVATLTIFQQISEIYSTYFGDQRIFNFHFSFSEMKSWEKNKL